MATHKVPQDVEADDKFLGPLSFKQFIFGGLTVICGYLTFILITKNLAFLSPIFALPMIVFGFLTFPWSKEQPTELWLASRIRFLIKPRKRIWDQSGMKHLVEITVPKKAIHNYTDGLSPKEVHSRLSALATMIDSRGWAVKNYSGGAVEPSDRLVQGNTQSSTPAITEDPDDVMDENRGVIAQQFETRIQESEQKHKSEARRLIEEARQESQQPTQKPNPNGADKPLQKKPESTTDSKKEDFWFMHQQQTAPNNPNLATFSNTSVIRPGEDKTAESNKSQSDSDKPLDEAALLEQVHEKQRRDAMQTSHIKKVDPFAKTTYQASPKQPEPAPQAPQNQSVTTETKPDMLKYVYNNDLDVETIQRQGHKKDDNSDDEVVISLH